MTKLRAGDRVRISWNYLPERAGVVIKESEAVGKYEVKVYGAIPDKAKPFCEVQAGNVITFWWGYLSLISVCPRCDREVEELANHDYLCQECRYGI
jgi:hypothetical protein